MGGAIISGVLVLVVMTVAFLLGPVIGLISGLRVGGDRGRSSESYLAGLLGSVTGYFVMIVLVLLAMSAVMAMGAGGGGGAAADTAGQASSSGGSSGGLPIGEYVVPIIAAALPTGLTGLGGVFLGGNDVASSSGVTLPTKSIAAAIVVVGIVAAGVMVAPGLLSSEPQLEVDGSATTTEDTLYSSATVTNPTDSEVTTTLTVELVIQDEVVATQEDVITVPADNHIQVGWQLTTTADVTRSQAMAIRDGEMEIRYIIDGETLDTYPESA